MKKTFKTLDEQITILQNKGLIIKDISSDMLSWSCGVFVVQYK